MTISKISDNVIKLSKSRNMLRLRKLRTPKRHTKMYTNIRHKSEHTNVERKSVTTTHKSEYTNAGHIENNCIHVIQMLLCVCFWYSEIDVCIIVQNLADATHFIQIGVITGVAVKFSENRENVLWKKCDNNDNRIMCDLPDIKKIMSTGPQSTNKLVQFLIYL